MNATDFARKFRMAPHFLNNFLKFIFSTRHECGKLQHNQFQWSEDWLAHELYMQCESVPGEQ